MKSALFMVLIEKPESAFLRPPVSFETRNTGKFRDSINNYFAAAFFLLWLTRVITPSIARTIARTISRMPMMT